MAVIGVLPASGSAIRVMGLPKFCFPVNEYETAIEWHIRRMEEVCDEIVVTTRSIWIPLLQSLNLGSKTRVEHIEPSTMSSAVASVTTDLTARYVVGLPDTNVKDSDNFYSAIASDTALLSLALFDCPLNLRGRVGQVFTSKNKVTHVLDKDPNCTYSKMWGAFAFTGIQFNPELSHPGLEFNDFLSSGVTFHNASGSYYDLGSFQGLREFYI
jgi:hypothetical protein